MIYVIASLTIKPGEVAPLLAAAHKVIIATHTEPGCLRYDLHIDVTDDHKWTFVEEWVDRAALTAHFASPHMAVWAVANQGWFVDRKVEVVYPERVELL